MIQYKCQTFSNQYSQTISYLRGSAHDGSPSYLIATTKRLRERIRNCASLQHKPHRLFFCILYSVRRSLQRACRYEAPAVQDIHDLPQMYRTLDGERFLLHTSATDSGVTLIFATNESLVALSHTNRMVCDGTFKYAPVGPGGKFYQFHDHIDTQYFQSSLYAL